MVDMCREKKTGMAEECRQSDGKRALRACTECWSQWSSFKSGVTRSHFDFYRMSLAALFWIFCMRAICSSATPANVILT